MSHAVVLVEEESARIVVRDIAARLGIGGRTTVIAHEGQNDLEKSISNKLSRWRSPDHCRFLILRDNDGGDCLLLKQRLLRLVPDTARDKTRIRIVMQELEAWYVGDPQALNEAGFPSLTKVCRRARFRNSDRIAKPKLELKRILGSAFEGQISMARQIAPHLSLDGSGSTSFRQFLSALRWSSGLPPHQSHS